MYKERETLNFQQWTPITETSPMHTKGYGPKSFLIVHNLINHWSYFSKLAIKLLGYIFMCIHTYQPVRDKKQQDFWSKTEEFSKINYQEDNLCQKTGTKERKSKTSGILNQNWDTPSMWDSGGVQCHDISSCGTWYCSSLHIVQCNSCGKLKYICTYSNCY